MSDPTPAADVCARYRVVHETRYRYQSMVSLSQQYLHMTPRSFAFQETESHLIWLDPPVSDSLLPPQTVRSLSPRPASFP